MKTFPKRVSEAVLHAHRRTKLNSLETVHAIVMMAGEGILFREVVRSSTYKPGVVKKKILLLSSRGFIACTNKGGDAACCLWAIPEHFAAAAARVRKYREENAKAGRERHATVAAATAPRLRPAGPASVWDLAA